MKIVCCDVEPVDLGEWPVQADKFEKKDGLLVIDGIASILAHRYHCKVCNKHYAVVERIPV